MLAFGQEMLYSDIVYKSGRGPHSAIGTRFRDRITIDTRKAGWVECSEMGKVILES